jgi:acyl-CoA synthetase (AMP-forming)/AMP-acid ligase II
MTWFDAPPLLLPELIALQGRWRGSHAALVSGARRLSWRQFADEVDGVARALGASGARPGDAVLVVMRNSIEMALVMFGALRAGCVVVPLNVSVSDDAMGAMLGDCAATIVVASDEHCARFTANGRGASQVRHWIAVDPNNTGSLSDSPLWQPFAAWLANARRDARPLPAIDPEAPCNIIYSSGTTGVPKGIVHTHRRRLDWASDIALALRYDSGAITLCNLGLYSNISWASMLATILVGGTLVIEPGFDAARTLATIERERVTHGSMVPLQYQRLLEHPDFRRYDLSSLRSVMCCGSPLPAPLKRRALTELGCQFIELYGLTEGVITTLAPEEALEKLASVGRPLPGTDIKILDESNQEVPHGVAGEIVSRGRIVMAGYWQRDDANAEATWVDAQGRRWLRTGDIGRVDEDGFLYLVDRKKDLILSGGQNIYPADIEAVMLQHPWVSEVAVIGVPSERWGETPLAYVVPRQGAPSEGEALRTMLREWTNERVGKQQRIADVALIDALPRNPNGKILKRELRQQQGVARV